MSGKKPLAFLSTTTESGSDAEFVRLTDEEVLFFPNRKIKATKSSSF